MRVTKSSLQLAVMPSAAVMQIKRPKSWSSCLRVTLWPVARVFANRQSLVQEESQDVPQAQCESLQMSSRCHAMPKVWQILTLPLRLQQGHWTRAVQLGPRLSSKGVIQIHGQMLGSPNAMSDALWKRHETNASKKLIHPQKTGVLPVGIDAKGIVRSGNRLPTTSHLG